MQINATNIRCSAKLLVHLRGLTTRQQNSGRLFFILKRFASAPRKVSFVDDAVLRSDEKMTREEMRKEAALYGMSRQQFHLYFNTLLEMGIIAPVPRAPGKMCLYFLRGEKSFKKDLGRSRRIGIPSEALVSAAAWRDFLNGACTAVCAKKTASVPLRDKAKYLMCMPGSSSPGIRKGLPAGATPLSVSLMGVTTGRSNATNSRMRKSAAKAGYLDLTPQNIPFVTWVKTNGKYEDVYPSFYSLRDFYAWRALASEYDDTFDYNRVYPAYVRGIFQARIRLPHAVSNVSITFHKSVC